MNPLFNDNALKLGIFCTNGHGAALSLAPEAVKTDWEMSRRTAVAADRAGLEAVVPYARWKGYVKGQATHRTGNVFETFTWAAGIAAATERISVFATSHAPTQHPIVAAKQAATIDHISGGRFALNVVGGWSRPELEMFGGSMLEHNQRYEHLTEWLEVMRRLWSATEEFDYHGRFFDVVGGVSMPKPIQSTIPIMNAASSARGMEFAAEYADFCFVVIHNDDEAAIREQVERYKAAARERFGRNVEVWIHAVVVQGDSDAEAERELHRFSVEYQDREAVSGMMGLHEGAHGADQQMPPPEVIEKMRQRVAAGALAFPLVGTPDTIAERLEMLNRAGIQGTLLTWLNYDTGLTSFLSDVLPRLEKAGLRAPYPGH